MLSRFQKGLSLTPALLVLAACGSGSEFLPQTPTGSSTPAAPSSSSSGGGATSSSSSSSSSGGASGLVFELATIGLASGQSFGWSLSYNHTVVLTGTINANDNDSITAPVLPSGETYDFSVVQQPTGQTCTASSNTGTLSNGASPPAVEFSCANGSGAPAAVDHELATPGARQGASSWIERNGSLALFGGESQDATGSGHAENDVWRYSASTRSWAPLVATTTPPAARSFAASWLDARGDVWIFGGRRAIGGSVQLFDDLWEFTPGTRAWSCQSGCVGEDGVVSGEPRPEARLGAATWVDGNGDLWLAGGSGAGLIGDPQLADVWRYTPASHAWTQVRGP